MSDASNFSCVLWVWCFWKRASWFVHSFYSLQLKKMFLSPAVDNIEIYLYPVNILLTFLTISNLPAAPLVWWRDLCCFVKSRNLSGIQNKTPPSICSLQLGTSLQTFKLLNVAQLHQDMRFSKRSFELHPRTLSGLDLSSKEGDWGCEVVNGSTISKYPGCQGSTQNGLVKSKLVYNDYVQV